VDFQYTIYPEKEFVEERFQGTVEIKGLIEALQQIFADPAWNPQYNGIVDLREANMELRYPDVRTLVDFQKSHPLTSQGQWAFIADKDKNFGTMRMFHALSSELGFEVNIFKTKAEAMAWHDQLPLRPLNPPAQQTISPLHS